MDIKGDERFAALFCPLLEKSIEEFFPGDGMHVRRFGEHAVEIEQDGIVIAGRK
jgi:hypothetical protein